MRIACGLIPLEQQIHGAGVRELRRLPETAVVFIKQMERRFDDSVYNPRIEFTARRTKHFRLGDGFLERHCRSVHFGTPRFERFGDGGQDALETRPAHGVFGREISAAEKWFSIGRKERSQGPAALPGNCADRGLITRINVRAFVAIHLHRNVQAVDHRRDLRIFVALAVDNVAPVAPDRANIQQDRFIFGACARKRFFAPLVPVDRLVRRGTKIGAGRIFQAIFDGIGHEPSDEVGGRQFAPCIYWIGLL